MEFDFHVVQLERKIKLCHTCYTYKVDLVLSHQGQLSQVGG